jgi:6-pyruvoyltetrahydropterin/6-carboxytetrahydropterin synthase
MLRLTRDVRFALRPNGSLPPDGKNGFAGRPSLDGIGFHFELTVALTGDIDPASSYLRNIVDIDREVRTRAVPVVQRFVCDQATHDVSALLVALRAALAHVEPAWMLDGLLLKLSPFLRHDIDSQDPPMISRTQCFEFSAAHRLHNPALSDADNVRTFGKCNNPLGHGHNYVVEVSIGGRGTEMTLPGVSEVEAIVAQHAIDPLDHKHLNAEVPEFAALNPSVENIAKVIYGRLKQPLASLRAVKVWETPKTSAEYSEDR